MGKNNARLPDIQTLLQAGIDPKTGLPFKFSSADKCHLKNDIKKNIRIMDEQVALKRYKWNNLPKGLTSNIIERILYYKGQGMLFKLMDNFYFLPYALNGSIDVYGRFTGVTPLPFNGKSSTDKDGKELPWIEGLKRIPIYTVDDLEEQTDLNEEDYCILLSDYSKQMSQTVLPRQILNEGIIDFEAECYPFLRTAMIAGTGIEGMRVQDPGQAANVIEASKGVEEAALSGQPWVPVVGSIEFQELTDGTTTGIDQYLVAMQSVDNF